MDFGLGLVLSFTDNATAGINNAVNTLNQLTKTAESASGSLNEMASLSALSVVSGQIGNSFANMGHTILSTLGQVISSINQTGSTLYYAENQLDALYGGVGRGAEVIARIQDYAKTSMFEFENLIPAVTSLKSVGIEAFDSIASSTGNAQHNLLDYASALASFAPQMKNAYGTGINAAIGAMREYIAEGNALSLKRGAGLDITGILGEDKGATIEERTRQVADLIEQLGMMGMVETMAKSPMTMLSNMGDVLFQLKGMISDSGVYEKFTELISKLAGYVMAIPDEELQSIANTIGSALTAIMTPLDWVADRLIVLVDGLRNLVQTNPELIKFATVGVSIAGVLLVLAGVVLKAMSAMSGLSLFMLAFGQSFKSIGGTIKSGSVKILGTLAPLVATIGLLALAWRNDLAGIRTSVTNFATNMAVSFKTARKAVNGNVEDLVSTLTELKNKDDFFSNITLGIMKVMMFARALSDAWGDYTLSEDNYLKAKELGILPLIEALLDLKYRFGLFKEGFIAGWKSIGENVRQMFEGFKESVKGTFLEDMLNNLTLFFQKLSSGDADAWFKFGESFARFTASALVFWSAMKVVGKVVSIITGIKTAIGGVASFVKGLGIFSFIGKFVEVFKLVAGGAGTFSEALKAVFGTASTVVAGVASVIGGALIAITNFLSMLKNGFSWVKEVLMVVGIALATVGAIILGAPALITGVIGAIIAAIATAVVVIKEHWSSIKEFFIEVGTKIGEFFGGLWEKVKFGFGVVADTITGTLKGAVNTVLLLIGSIINGVIWGINKAIDVINAIPGVSISKITQLEIPMLAEGGVVTKPTMSVIGEAGAEAVMPLENNTGWITKLAGMISTQMGGFTPTNSNVHNTNNQNQNNQRYLTNTHTNNQTIHGDTDNSVIFNEGAINVTVQNASEEEAIRLARKILEYIKRQQQLDSMLSYA